MKESQLTELIRKYLSGEANKAEREQVERWYEAFDASSPEWKDLQGSLSRSFERIQERIAKEHESGMLLKEPHRFNKWYAVAAAVVILVIGSIFFLQNNHRADISNQELSFVKKDSDFNPGGNKATLTLGNGQVIILDSISNGALAKQGQVRIVKVNNGLLSYNATTSNSQLTTHNSQREIQYNTISTPRGGKYEIVLPDGSKIWLNAASSLKFPTAFAGEKREVEMTGEAYFEIAQNASQPFIVHYSSTAGRAGSVQVLGTHFNVMAYKNEEETRVSLLEGSVKIYNGIQPATGNSQLLKPGEQIKVGQNGRMELVKNANLSKAIAWKNNLFWFEDDDIQEVMKQLSRWYNVDIEIKGNISDHFTGSIPQSLTFAKVFEVLQKTGSIHYEIRENRKVVVTPGVS